MTEPDGHANPVIFFVEDEEDTADLVAVIMEGDGDKVVHAADGRQALR